MGNWYLKNLFKSGAGEGVGQEDKYAAKLEVHPGKNNFHNDYDHKLCLSTAAENGHVVLERLEVGPTLWLGNWKECVL